MKKDNESATNVCGLGVFTRKTPQTRRKRSIHDTDMISPYGVQRKQGTQNRNTVRKSEENPAVPLIFGAKY